MHIDVYAVFQNVMKHPGELDNILFDKILATTI